MAPAAADDPDGDAATRERFRAFAARIEGVSSTYARWSRTVADSDEVVPALLGVPSIRRQPELVLAVARRLGADPADPSAIVRLAREGRGAFQDMLRSATMQTNDPRRLAPIVPLVAAVEGPIAIVDIGTSAGLCTIPDRVRLTVETPGGVVTWGPTGGDASSAPAAAGGSALALSVQWSGVVPEPPGRRVDVVRRIGLDPAPLDVRDPATTDRLRESVPPEAVDRVALMAAAAAIVRHEPPVMVTGVVPRDLGRALALVPDGVTPVVVTSGTLVYVPGAERQAFVDRIAALAVGRAGRPGVRWIAVERTGILHGVAGTMPEWWSSSGGSWSDGCAAHAVAPDDAFATVSLDGVAVALTDAYGTRTHWLRAVAT